MLCQQGLQTVSQPPSVKFYARQSTPESLSLLSQENFYKLDILRLLLRSGSSQNATTIYPPVVSAASEVF